MIMEIRLESKSGKREPLGRVLKFKFINCLRKWDTQTLKIDSNRNFDQLYSDMSRTFFCITSNIKIK